MYAGELFGHSLLESSFPRRRSWPAVLAYCAQALAVALVLLAPIIANHGLPQLALSSHVIVPWGFAAHPASVPNTGGNRGAALAPPTTTALIFNDHANRTVRADINSAPASDDTTPCTVNCGGSIGDFTSAVPPSLLNSAMPSRPAPPPAKPHVVRVSNMNEGWLIHRVEPIYPRIAIMARIEGPVNLAAVIARDGTIENLRVLSGHPMLAPAAVDAVRQWRYRPYILDGEPVEVETQIRVNFILGK